LEPDGQKSNDSTNVWAIVPLRKRAKNGSLYCRPAEIEAAIAELAGLSKQDFVERIRANDLGHGVATECLLYFLRRPPFGGDEDFLFTLFAAIRQRVLKAVPVPTVRNDGDSKNVAVRLVDLDIQEAVLDRFQKMICVDRQEYVDRLDFFECRFNAGMARLRSTVRRDIWKKANKSAPLVQDITNEPSPEVEEALSRVSDSCDGPRADFLYRSKIHAAINSLPLDERRVVELFLMDIPIDSQEAETMTMVKMLGCAEKTVRNRRGRAFARLKELLREDNT
jgi:hypothetical protein